MKTEVRREAERCETDDCHAIPAPGEEHCEDCLQNIGEAAEQAALSAYYGGSSDEDSRVRRLCKEAGR